MSSTTPGAYQGFEFWVHDVSLSILLAEMINVVEETPPHDRSEWLAGLLPELRVHAVVGDYHLPVDGWAAGREDEFVDLVAAACRRLAARRVITAEDAAQWRILDDSTVLWRGADEVSVQPIVGFGEALIRIVRGTYPPAPSGQQWHFGSHGNADQTLPRT